MATRIYLESNGTPVISPTPDSGWTDTSQFTRFNAGSTKAGSTMTTDNISDAISTQADILIGQWITPVMTVGSTISNNGTHSIQIRASETAAQNNLFISWGVWVYNGTTKQFTLVAKQNDGTETVTSLTNRRDTKTAVTGNYTTVAGDQLVIEVGLEGDPTSSNTHNGAISYGSDSGTDLPADDTTTAANNPYVDINGTITFVSGETITADMWHPTSNQPFFEPIKVVSYFILNALSRLRQILV